MQDSDFDVCNWGALPFSPPPPSRGEKFSLGTLKKYPGGGRGEKLSLETLEKYGTRRKSANGTGAEGHQPRSCSHQNHYITSGIPQHGDSTTVDQLFKRSTQYTY